MRAFRATILDFTGDPLQGEAALRHYPDGLLFVEGGRVQALGDYRSLERDLGGDVELVDFSGRLILPGFIDAHVHYAQTDVIASRGIDLLDWLRRHTFPAEAAFADPQVAIETARFFCRELLRNGSTSAMVFATVHPQSVDAIFAEAERLGMRLIAGKLLMDRNAPRELLDTARDGYEQSAGLIERWHGRGRLGYAITPRFAPTSSAEQLELAGLLWREHPSTWLQSHVAENRDELRWVAELFPWSRSYLDVYDHFGLLGERAVYAHCIHLDAADRERMVETGTAAAFCPTSNLFLGSGLFDLADAERRGMALAMGSDIGGGTSFSLLRTLAEGYKVSQLGGYSPSPLRAFYDLTLGAARALRLDEHIGNFEPGKEADFVVIDFEASELMARRIARCDSLQDRLFALMMLGDDRHVDSTWLMGECRYRRETGA
jgi:guanine deaminase